MQDACPAKALESWWAARKGGEMEFLKFLFFMLFELQQTKNTFIIVEVIEMKKIVLEFHIFDMYYWALYLDLGIGPMCLTR